MRTIKFRAWDEAKKEFASDKDTIYISDDGNCYTLKSTNYNGDYLNGEKLIVQMFTGLFDKHGKEIYEGDEYDIGICTKVIRPDFFIEDTYELMQLLKDNAVVELTGRNIYESPELLK